MKKISWTESERHAIVAYQHILRAMGLLFWLDAISKTPIQQVGRPRKLGYGQVQEVRRKIRLYARPDQFGFDNYVEVDMVGQRWRGKFCGTYWHVTDGRVVNRGKVGMTFRYDYCSDVHDPHWSGYPIERDLRKVTPDGKLVPLPAR